MNGYITTVDIGSSLVRVLIGMPEEDGTIRVMGVGATPSRGVRAGVIVNIEHTAAALTDAVREAELMSGLVADNAYVSISGRSLHGDNSRGVAAITNKEGTVRESDVLRTVEGARNIRLSSEKEILHVLSREFSVDGQVGIKDPVGMSGVRLEAEVHIVSVDSSVLNNIERSASIAGFRVQAGVMNSLAAAEAVMGPGEAELGAAVIDIGGGTVDIAVYSSGGISYSAVVPLGGSHITQDVSIALGIPLEIAEMVKKTYGSALASLVDPTERIELPGMPGRPARWVTRDEPAAVIEARMREILEMADAVLIRSGHKTQLAGGVILTGGCCLLEGVRELAEDVFSLPASIGYCNAVQGFAERVSGAEYSVLLGLMRYAAKTGSVVTTPVSRPRNGYAGGNENIVHRMKNWIAQNL